jgi:hypothetical protein
MGRGRAGWTWKIDRHSRYELIERHLTRDRMRGQCWSRGDCYRAVRAQRLIAVLGIMLVARRIGAIFRMSADPRAESGEHQRHCDRDDQLCAHRVDEQDTMARDAPP